MAIRQTPNLAWKRMTHLPDSKIFLNPRLHNFSKRIKESLCPTRESIEKEMEAIITYRCNLTTIITKCNFIIKNNRIVLHLL